MTHGFIITLKNSLNGYLMTGYNITGHGHYNG
jgi:hypothetical protein